MLLCTILAKKTGLDLDGYVGAAVAVFILISGFSLVRDTLDPLLGKAPSPETVRHIRDKIMAYPGVLGVHEFMTMARDGSLPACMWKCPHGKTRL